MVRMPGWLTLALTLGVAGTASAQVAMNEGAPHREGDYQGVTPGESDATPAKTRYPRLTWVGFIPGEGGSSRFFLQLNRDVEVDQVVDDKGVLHVTVPGARFGSRNAQRRLDTRYFDTSVSTIQLRRVGRKRARRGQPAQRAGIRLDIRFKNPADATQAQASVEAKKDGYHYLFLDFGPGAPAPESADSTEPR